MTLFGSNNCVYAIPRIAVGTGVALSGLNSGPPILLRGVSLNDTDINLPVTTLGRQRFMYNFGKMISPGVISGLALLGYGYGVSNLSRAVESLRTSSGKGLTSLSTPLGGWRVFVTGFSMGEPDHEFNLQPFGIHFSIGS